MILENFAVLEGIDGAGTTTQLELLKNRIAHNNPALKDRFVFTAEPAQTPVGVFIRSVLSGGVSVEPGTLAYLFAADRYEHVHGKDGIAAAHASGKAVICDRYVFSSLAYQGPLCGIELPQKLNEDFPLPHILFYFEIDIDTALLRISSRKQKEIFETKKILAQTAAEYKRVIEHYENQTRALSNSMNIIHIDAALSIEQIHQIIWSELAKMPIFTV